MFDRSDQIFKSMCARSDKNFEKQHEELDKIGNELVSIN